MTDKLMICPKKECNYQGSIKTTHCKPHPLNKLCPIITNHCPACIEYVEVKENAKNMGD